MTYQQFNSKWKELDIVGRGFLKLPFEHPIDYHVGYTEEGNKALIAMDVGKRSDIPCSSAIKAENRQLQNQKWSLELQLLQSSYEEEYLHLCWDIITYSNKAENAVEAMIRRYTSWQKLLQYAKEGSLSFSRQKGLLGELLFLKESFATIGYEATIKSWTGPDGSDQDFLFEKTWSEVKAVSLAAESVKISSFEQLKQEIDGELTVYVLERTNPGDNSVVLPDLVEQIRDILSEDEVLLDSFNMKLYKYGYRDKDADEYRKNTFRFVEKRIYNVDSNFPRLTRDNVRSEIVSGTYSLSLAAIEQFRRG